MFFFSHALTADLKLDFDWITGQVRLLLWEKKGVHAKANFGVLTPGMLLTFLLTQLFLAQLSLGKFKIYVYCECNFHNLGYIVVC